eukprot:2526549-Rhodomonas_salina.4
MVVVRAVVKLRREVPAPAAQLRVRLKRFAEQRFVAVRFVRYLVAVAPPSVPDSAQYWQQTLQPASVLDNPQQYSRRLYRTAKSVPDSGASSGRSVAI